MLLAPVINPENGGIIYSQNVLLPDYTASHTRREVVFKFTAVTTLKFKNIQLNFKEI
jgi:hypothetical protein